MPPYIMHTYFSINQCVIKYSFNELANNLILMLVFLIYFTQLKHQEMLISKKVQLEQLLVPEHTLIQSVLSVSCILQAKMKVSLMTSHVLFILTKRVCTHEI